MTIIVFFVASPLVAGHGKIAIVTGGAGGSGTVLGIKGPVVLGLGPNYKTEVDTTVFWSKDIATDQDILTMSLSNDTLAQVSSGGSVSGAYHVVTDSDDGRGPVKALTDASAKGKWSAAVAATVTTDMPGTAGKCPSSLANDGGSQNKLEVKRAATRLLSKMDLVAKRADNINKDCDFRITTPTGFLGVFLLFRWAATRRRAG